MEDKIIELIEKVKKQSQLVHSIMNYVTINDCANVLLAIGASPIMADAPMEVEEITAMADANFLIEKSESDFRTHTDIKRLNEEECLSELSRLQGSVGPDELSYRNALELKNWANSYKKSRKR